MKQQNNENSDINSSKNEVSYRKPFKPEMGKNWWMKLNYYLFYIIRESSAFFMIWVSLILMYGVICAYTNEQGQDEFYRFIFFLQNPFVVVINTLALLAALLHTVTWFNLAPKAANLVIGGKKPPAILLVASLWIVTIAASAVLLLLVLNKWY